jgi:MscS family membrane protein
VTAYSVILGDNIDLKEEKPLISRTLFPLLSKILKVFIMLLAIVAIASEFDFTQLGSILAGVGIGGAAIALASQDLIKNFFGGFIVLTDRSFDVGDFINIDSTEGTVEELGLRSTRIRTLNQELVVVPNSKFTGGAVINYTKRSFRRASFRVGATYDTSSKKLKTLIERIKSMLDSHLMVKEDSAIVKFDNFSSSSLDIWVQYMVNTANYAEYLSIKDEINFNIMNLFEDEGVSFAFPSVSVYMEKNI